MNNVGTTMNYGITFTTMIVIAVMFELMTEFFWTKEKLHLINYLTMPD